MYYWQQTAPLSYATANKRFASFPQFPSFHLFSSRGKTFWGLKYLINFLANRECALFFANSPFFLEWRYLELNLFMSLRTNQSLACFVQVSGLIRLVVNDLTSALSFKSFLSNIRASCLHNFFGLPGLLFSMVVCFWVNCLICMSVIASWRILCLSLDELTSRIFALFVYTTQIVRYFFIFGIRLHLEYSTQYTSVKTYKTYI